MKHQRLIFKSLFLVVLTLLVSRVTLSAQEDQVTSEEPAVEPAETPQAAPTDPGSDSGADESDPSLFRATLAQDIVTAGFYELVAWLRSLDLPIDGNRAAMQARLAAYYSVSAQELDSARQAQESGGQDAGRAIVIDSASRTEYFRIEEIEERYIRLAGDVVVTLTDEGNNVRHQIRADEITVNQAQQTLSASGSVVYTVERGGTTERFVGEALSVDLESFEGAFVRGVSQQERNLDGDEVEFRFSGEYITRSEDDVIVLEDGSITSSEADPPYYQIRAQKIWVLAPGEWGLSNAVLYVGRVPLFYVPFFFRPGNRLFFNPAIGTRDREGIFLQTTTYLAGTPPAPDSPFSLLQLAEASGADQALRRDGLYLVADEGVDASDDATVRLLLDVYTKLGAFAAIDGELPSLLLMNDVAFYGALAVSRHIYRTGGYYTPYYVDGGAAAFDWNTTDFAGISLPFRFGLSFSGELAEAGAAASLAFEWYSDPRFPADFGDRSQQIDWLGLLDTGVATGASPLSSLVWTLRGSYRPASGTLPPTVGTLQLRQALINLRFARRAIDTSLLPPEVQSASDSPEASFFYPDSMRLPELSATVGGTLLEIPARRRAEDDDSESQAPPIIPPWDDESATENESDSEVDAGAGSAIVAPPLRDALPSAVVPSSPASVNLAYTVSPNVIVDHEFASDDWSTPSDVDLDIAYRGASSRATGSASLSGELVGGVLGMENRLSVNGQHRTVFDRADEIEQDEWDSLTEQAWRFTSFSLTNRASITAKPLVYSSIFGQSSVSYSALLLLYRYQFDQVVAESPVYSSDWIDWGATDFVRQHELQATLAADLGEAQQLRVSAVLPPFDPSYTGSMLLRRKPFTLQISGGSSFENGEWSTSPLGTTLTVSFPNLFTLRNDLTYDIDNSEFSVFSSRFNWDQWRASFEARNVEGYQFGGAGVGWVGSGDVAFRPVRASLAFSVDREIQPFWRGRVAASVETRVSVNADLLRFTQSNVSFDATATVTIHEFMALQFSATSSNGQVYVYFPPLAERVGREPRNVVTDLVRSFNVFSDQDRRTSGFKLQRLEIGVLHDLGDWDLSVLYTARPALQTSGPDAGLYTIDRSLEINLSWRAIDELSASASVDEDEFTIGGDS